MWEVTVNIENVFCPSIENSIILAAIAVEVNITQVGLIGSKTAEYLADVSSPYIYENISG